MQHLEDITSVARMNVREREERAARRRLAREATAGQPSLLQRTLTAVARVHRPHRRRLPTAAPQRPETAADLR